MMLKGVLIGVLWLTYGVLLFRALRCGRFGGACDHRIWLTYACALIAFSLWGETTEQWFDRLFFDLPIAVYLKYIFLMWSGYLYYQILRDVHDWQHPLDRYVLVPLVPVATVIGTVSFVVHLIWSPMPASELRYLVIGGRDAVVVIYVVCRLVGGTFRMVVHEAIIAMRIKQIAIVACAICFAVASTASFTAAWLVLTGADVARVETAALALQPVLYIGGLCFLVMLIPFRWFQYPLRLYRLYTYFRIKRLDHRIASIVGVQSRRRFRRSLLTDSGELEITIYRLLISILERYHLMPADHPLYQSLHQQVNAHTDYEDLIRELSRI